MVEKQINFEIALSFHSPNRRVKKRGNFKPNLFFDQMELFLFCLSSNYLPYYNFMIITCAYPKKGSYFLFHQTSFEISAKNHAFVLKTKKKCVNKSPIMDKKSQSWTKKLHVKGSKEDLQISRNLLQF